MSDDDLALLRRFAAEKVLPITIGAKTLQGVVEHIDAQEARIAVLTNECKHARAWADYWRRKAQGEYPTPPAWEFAGGDLWSGYSTAGGTESGEG
ncbi:MAG: hypothetical protein JWP44_4505 [Mucilaginibacter sp.]|nr:hypothetical protein [Mucilaginibacter sp.]